ncbi:MAG: GAF domain-containing sensor histidine kinase [Deltaproteobacteria bacterium]|nr:GAF domain-containing sensor histidine kinase [Deltaproteobacteria bacterium]
MTDPNTPLELQSKLSHTRRRLASLKGIVINLESTMSFDEVLTLAVERTTSVMGAERTTLFVTEPDGSLVSRVIEGGDVKEIRLAPGQGLAGWTCRHGVPLVIPNAYADERFDKRWDAQSGFTTRNVLCHPIFGRGGTVIGVVEVLNSSDGDFGEDDVLLLSTVANQLAMVLENSRVIVDLVEKNRTITAAKLDLEKRNRELNVLLDLEKVLARAEDMDSLGSRSFARILEILDSQIGSFYLLDAGGAQKRTYSADGTVATLARVEAGAGFTGWVAAKHQELHLREPGSDPRYEEMIQRRTGVDISQLIAVPLPFSEISGIQGSILIANKKGGRDFEESDKILLRLIASQLSTAIEHLQGRTTREREHRLATVGRLLAGILHDLRTPITTISGYAEMLSETCDENESDEYLGFIRNALDRIKRMTSDIIAFSRGEKDLLITSVSLNEFIEKFANEVQHSLKSHNIELIIRKRTSGTIKVDEEKMLRVFHNIANNASDAMPTGGQLIFECDRIEDRLIFSFTDSGSGIPEEIQGTVFNSFVSYGKDSGTGLGLAVAREIVTGHGGSISFTTSPGAGTTFLISVPG